MIGYLKGTIHAVGEQHVLIEVCGVGYVVYTTLGVITKAVIGEGIAVYTHEHIREDARDLYGFTDQQELDVFMHLTSVSGIGPKTALAALTMANASHMISAIVSGDVSLVQRVPGIGSKTAQRVVLELKDRLSKQYGPVVVGIDSTYQEDADILDALVGLGYPLITAQDALKAVPADIIGMQDRLKAALKMISNR